MLKTLTLILIGAAFLAAETPASTQPSKPMSRQSAASPTPAIPDGAAQVEPNLYRYTDAQGKTWLYRRTPFGVSKWEDKPAPQPVVKDAAPVTITDLGDRIQFERKTPFGTAKWVRMKDQLTFEEKLLVTPGQQAQAQPEIQTAEKQ